jgi:hypothetical protein
MTPVTLVDPHVQAALRHGVHALKRVAKNILPAALDQRMRQLGDRGSQTGFARFSLYTSSRALPPGW